MKRLLLSFFAVLTVSLTASEDQAEAIIKRARAAVGDDAVLNQLVTLKIRGSIKPADSKLPSARFLLIARKPCSQRLEVRIDNLVETTLLEDCSGCIIRTDLENADGRSQFRKMGDEEVQRMAFNTRQLFNFYREDVSLGEKVSYEGLEQRWKTQCNKLVYAYPEGTLTTRYFSVDSGKLVSTITDKGVENIEVGTQTVEGIQFPRKIEYHQGEQLLHTLILETIEVNKPLRAGIFTISTVTETK